MPDRPGAQRTAPLPAAVLAARLKGLDAAIPRADATFPSEAGRLVPHPGGARSAGCIPIPFRLKAPLFRSRRAIGMPWRFLVCHPSWGRSLRARSEMPKLKTKSGAKKRFKITASGKVKAGVAGKRHRLISHNAKYIRSHRGTKVMCDADAKTIKSWLPYG